MKTLTIYSRQDCHLCDELAAALMPIVHGRGELRIVDIGHDQELERAYGMRIPVLVGGGEELPTNPLDVDAIEAFLASSDG